MESDELQIRRFSEEGDLLVVEVQASFADRAMPPHTRSLTYCKVIAVCCVPAFEVLAVAQLRNGRLVFVSLF